MASSSALVCILTFAILTVSAAKVVNCSVIAVAKSGLVHLDSSGVVLAWKPELKMEGQVATNPENGTVCWTREREDLKTGGLVRCAEMSNLNQTWDLSLPLSIQVNRVKAFSFDWAAQNWYITVETSVPLLKNNGATPLDVCRSYVCSYSFEKCLAVAEFAPNSCDETLVAYDISNRRMFYIGLGRLMYRLKSMQLDGYGLRELNTEIRRPNSLALDPVNRHIYWTDLSAYGNSSALNRIDYDWTNKKVVIQGSDRVDAMDALQSTVVLVKGGPKIISVVDGDTGEMTDIMFGTLKGEAASAVRNIDNLLGIHIVSSEENLNSNNPCISEKGDGCEDFCIPTTTNNSQATATCLCREGLHLVDMECRMEHPSFALLVGANSLQAVDLRTEKVSTILSNLTDGTRMDVYRVSDSEFLLFWLDAGSLFRGRWSPGGLVTDVQRLVSAAEGRQWWRSPCTPVNSCFSG